VTTSASRGLTIAAVATGVAIGFAYALSPLTVWFFVAAPALVAWAIRDLHGGERRWILGVLVIAIILRVAAMAGLFLSVDHTQVPFGSFFGDEEYFLRRSMWLRNVAFGLPVHRADLIYAFDDYSYTVYLYVLSFLQALAGFAPYGTHLFGCALYLAMCIVLFRIVRARFGRVAAAVGLMLLLFLPSLFAWSISALKEPLYFLLAAMSVWLVDWAARVPRATTRAIAVVALAGVGIALQAIREGGLLMFATGVVGGAALTYVLRRPRLAVATAVVAPAVIVALLLQPAFQVRTWSTVKEFARIHVGHVTTPGYTYKLLDARLYDDVDLRSITIPEELRFVGHAFTAYVVQPTPRSIQSRATLAYLPEQVVWYGLVLLVPVGIVAAARRDLLLTSVLLMYALAAAVMVALTGGNVGTLVRHRGLALPYLVWFSGLGASRLVASITRARASNPEDIAS